MGWDSGVIGTQASPASEAEEQAEAGSQRPTTDG